MWVWEVAWLAGNFVKFFFHSTGPFGSALFEIISKTLILAFETNSEASPNCTFSNFNKLWVVDWLVTKVYAVHNFYVHIIYPTSGMDLLTGTNHNLRKLFSLKSWERSDNEIPVGIFPTAILQMYFKIVC